MTIRLKLFAILRERSGVAETQLDIADGATVSSAIEAAARKFPGIAEFMAKAAVAVNLDYAQRSTVLRDNDELALIPPVSGGRA